MYATTRSITRRNSRESALELIPVKVRGRVKAWRLAYQGQLKKSGKNHLARMSNN